MAWTTKQRVRIPVREGGQTVHKWATVHLEINLHILAEVLGAKAAANKSRKSKLAVGITAELGKVERE